MIHFGSVHSRWASAYLSGITALVIVSATPLIAVAQTPFPQASPFPLISAEPSDDRWETSPFPPTPTPGSYPESNGEAGGSGPGSNVGGGGAGGALDQWMEAQYRRSLAFVDAELASALSEVILRLGDDNFQIREQTSAFLRGQCITIAQSGDRHRFNALILFFYEQIASTPDAEIRGRLHAVVDNCGATTGLPLPFLPVFGRFEAGFPPVEAIVDPFMRP